MPRTTNDRDKVYRIRYTVLSYPSGKEKFMYYGPYETLAAAKGILSSRYYYFGINDSAVIEVSKLNWEEVENV